MGPIESKLQANWAERELAARSPFQVQMDGISNKVWALVRDLEKLGHNEVAETVRQIARELASVRGK